MKCHIINWILRACGQCRYVAVDLGIKSYLLVIDSTYSKKNPGGFMILNDIKEYMLC